MPTKFDVGSIVRTGHLAETVVFIDGLPGCGKTMLSPIIAALDRAELLTFAYNIEYICALNHLGKIDHSAAKAMVGMSTDLQLYNTTMGREVNFRISDLSSVFNNSNRLRYFKRLFRKGDAETIRYIEEDKPILTLTTHNLLGISEPIFAALKQRATFIEVVRHPLYMIRQQALNMEGFVGGPRDFTIYFEKDEKKYPFWAAGWEKEYDQANEVEKSVLSIQHTANMTKKNKIMLREKHDAKIVTIPFERFVIAPWPYMEEIEKTVGTEVTDITRKMMKKQRVPRKMYASGLDLKIYRRCGWEPPQDGSNEQDEFDKRRRFAQQHCSPEIMGILEQLCQDYESNYLTK